MGKAFRGLMIASVSVGLILQLVGGIVYWVAAAGKDEDILLQMAVFYTAFALIVPIFVFVAYLKRARALYGLAILVTLLVVSVLTPPTNALRVIADKGLLTEDGKSYLSSFILIPIAMGLSLLPIVSYIRIHTIPTIAGVTVAILYAIGGAIFAARAHRFAPSLSGDAAVMFICALWALMSGLTKSLGTATALFVFCAVRLSTFYNGFLVYLMKSANPNGSGSSLDVGTGVAYIFAFIASLCWMAFCVLWFSRHSVRDSLKHAKKQQGYSILT